MEAPTGMRSLKDISQDILTFLAKKCVKDGEDNYKCKKCGATIQKTTLYISMHGTEFSSCAGSGEVQQRALPYCPECEGEPKEVRTCAHEPGY
jgi:ribosomal protein L37AE/L43A